MLIAKPCLTLLTAILGLTAICLPASILAGEAAPPKPEKLGVYVGTYTRGTSKGIYRLELDLGTGKLGSPALAGEAVNPTFLALHPNKPLLYAVGEMGSFAGKKTGAVSAFAIDRKTGDLTLLGQQSSGGAGPCHLVVDRSGRCVLVANYSGGSVACLPIQDDGRLGAATSVVQHTGSSVNKQRQQGPHAHSINVDPFNRFAFVADLGIDKVMIYRLDPAKGQLTANDPPSVSLAPGAGPRHFAFHPSGRCAYVIDELDSTITAFRYHCQGGQLQSVQSISTLPEGFAGSNTTAEVCVHPSGKFVYGSNRGHDSIACFAVEADTGRLSPLAHEPTQGKTPRNFNIDPSGQYLLAANQDGDNVVVFRIDRQTGKLRPAGSSVSIAAPVCVKFVGP